MTTFEGNYFDGSTPVSVPAKLDFNGREATVTTANVCARFRFTELSVSPRIGKTERLIALPNGGQFAGTDDGFFDGLPQESRSEGLVAWLEDRWGVALAGVVIIAVMLLTGYFYGLPAAAERIARQITIEKELALGDSVLSWFDEKGWMQPTRLEYATRDEIAAGFERLIADLALREYIRLEFRASRVFGANAFALPGGTIIITDDMVNKAASLEEVLAILAHEVGHVAKRHALRSVLQKSGIAIVVAAVTADAATLSAVITGLPLAMAQMKYSREFESEADEFAFILLRRKGYSPAAFADFMERLDKENSSRNKNASAFLSSHPLNAERAARARAAAAE